MLEGDGGSCLTDFKNGGKTDTTISKVDNVSSYTRNYLAGQYEESRGWLIIPTEKGPASSPTASIRGRRHHHTTDFSDVADVTPIFFIMKVL
ncbi:hypothetical protein FRB97_003085 [Tulasnella sp. 331]|nr:hypothetical protein FRB97_003085 [Tulasnella sp. 331]